MRKAGIYLCAAALAMLPPKWYDGNEQKNTEKESSTWQRKRKPSRKRVKQSPPIISLIYQNSFKH
ncbi:MAG: hypothetical protein Q3Y27_07895, partial [Clostridia bacterium]|nr:hypothetical protein [Clostridia bacterium]